MSDSGRDNPPPGPDNPGRRNLGIRALKALGAVVGLGVVAKGASMAAQSETGQQILNTAGEATARTFGLKDKDESDYAAQKRREQERPGMEAAKVLPRLSPTSSPGPVSPEEQNIRERNANDPNMVRATPRPTSKPGR